MQFLTSFIVALAAATHVAIAAPTAVPEAQLEQRDPQRGGTLYVIKRDETEVEKRDPQRGGTLYVIRREADGSEEQVDVNTLAERDPMLYEAIERMI